MWNPEWAANIKKLEDRFYEYVLIVVCLKCKHERRADPQMLARRVGGAAIIAEVMERMRCTQCQSRGAQHRIERKPVDRTRGKWR